ncbi:MAG TPA: methylated-DNA--[protein]-cysteine S-methyltransferase [Planctomycetota bacterium]|nr:methylated-DNA--[protein]-cysteine S-methyltransferase [Planctomycetota bacterium]
MHREYYQALLDRDPAYEGLVFFGIRTTGIVCRPTCPARKPKQENCEFFASVQEAMAAGYRPCKRCRPLDLPGSASPALEQLLAAIEAQPERRWSPADLAALGWGAQAAKRAFSARFGMTFAAYTRARRLAAAQAELAEGQPVTAAQIAAGYESSSGFRAAFQRHMGEAPSRAGGAAWQAEWFESPLGPMLAVGEGERLVLLGFAGRKELWPQMSRLAQRHQANLVPGSCSSTRSIRREIEGYFAGSVRTFETPIAWFGTEFQVACWQALKAIPFGETRSYAQLAVSMGRPTAVRAVAQANARNHLSLVLPCHRIVGSDGSLTGYAAGLARKRWLLDWEARVRDAQPKR